MCLSYFLSNLDIQVYFSIFFSLWVGLVDPIHLQFLFWTVAYRSKLSMLSVVKSFIFLFLVDV